MQIDQLRYAGIIEGMWGRQIVSHEEYLAWSKEYDKALPKSKSSYGKRPAQIQYVDANRTQTIPQMNYWMFILPVLVLGVVLIGGRA